MLYVVKAERGSSSGASRFYGRCRHAGARPARTAAEATGFALFRGVKPLEIVLFAHPDCAVAALPLLCMRSWHLKPATPEPSATEAFAVATTHFSRHGVQHQPPYISFTDSAPGVSGVAMILNKGLVYLRVEIKEDDTCERSPFALIETSKKEKVEMNRRTF